MSTVIVKCSSPWINIPATDAMRSYWINLATVRKITWRPNPVQVFLYYSGKEQQVISGIQAIAVIDAVKELTGEEPEDE